MAMGNTAIYLIIFVAILVACLLVFAGTLLATKLNRLPLFSATALVLVIYLAFYLLQVRNWVVLSGLVLVTAVLVGACIGRTVSSETALVALCTAAAVADLVSFSFGLTHVILSSYAGGRSRLLLYLTFSVPIRSHVVPLVGIGDFIILGAIFPGLRKLGYTLSEAFLAPVTGLMIAVMVGLLVNGIFALPFIAGAVIGYILIKRTMTRPSP